jgi:hypothetical protein
MGVVRRGDEHLKIGPDLMKSIRSVWRDKTVQQEALPRGNEFQFIESCPYFLDELERICSPDYIPSTQDMLMIRVTTTGIIEVGKMLSMLGSQKSSDIFCCPRKQHKGTCTVCWKKRIFCTKNMSEAFAYKLTCLEIQMHFKCLIV